MVVLVVVVVTVVLVLVVLVLVVLELVELVVVEVASPGGPEWQWLWSPYPAPGLHCATTVVDELVVVFG